MKPPSGKSLSRLRVALLETEPIRVQGFLALFSHHPNIEFVVFDLPRLLADEQFTLALIGMHGAQSAATLLGAIRGLRPTLRLLVMGPEADDETILAAIGAGAKAYLETNATPQQIEQAIGIVNQGSIWAPRRILSIFVDRATAPQNRSAPSPPAIQFTKREKQVLKLLVAARSNREIGKALGIEQRTVKSHVAKLMRKVGVENRITLSVHAVNGTFITKNGD